MPCGSATREVCIYIAKLRAWSENASRPLGCDGSSPSLPLPAPGPSSCCHCCWWSAAAADGAAAVRMAVVGSVAMAVYRPDLRRSAILLSTPTEDSSRVLQFLTLIQLNPAGWCACKQRRQHSSGSLLGQRMWSVTCLCDSSRGYAGASSCQRRLTKRDANANKADRFFVAAGLRSPLLAAGED